MDLLHDIFKNDPDLLDGFYQFLPDRKTQQPGAAAKLDEILARSKLDMKAAPRKKGESSTAPASVPLKRKRKVQEKDPPAKAGPSKVSVFIFEPTSNAELYTATNEAYKATAQRCPLSRFVTETRDNYFSSSLTCSPD